MSPAEIPLSALSTEAQPQPYNGHIDPPENKVTRGAEYEVARSFGGAVTGSWKGRHMTGWEVGSWVVAVPRMI